MGIDYGTKKLGVAFSDETGTMAFPHDTIPNDDKLLSVIESLIEEKGVIELVIGYSLGRDGLPNAVQEAIDEFAGDITLRTGIPIHFEPEQYTTQEAMRLQGKNAKTDASAAAIILNSFLTRSV
ncbi:Holliday junction resolvase RuvX [Candidatus Parcubacteria bacterium]|nr:Holliday junction resolvase RuvX [Candidatus Parcubacteria bacterium]